MNLYKYLLIAILAGAVIRAVIKSIKRNKKEWSTNEIKEKDPKEYKGKYKKKFILTLNEKNEHKKILSVTNNLNLILLAKVRLADVIEPISRQREWKTLFYKIQAKHLDFVVCKQNMDTLCAIEIDDRSHNRADRKARDNFVDEILQDVGIPMIRKINVNEQELKKEIETIMQK